MIRGGTAERVLLIGADAMTTIVDQNERSTAVLFGKTTLHMQPGSLIVIGVLTPLAGIGGSLLWPFLQRTFGWSNLRVLTTLVILASAVPAYPLMFDPASLNSRDTVVARDDVLARAAAEDLARRIVFWPQLKDTKA